MRFILKALPLLLIGNLLCICCVIGQQLPLPKGPFHSGRTTFVWVDSSRNDPWGVTNEKRKLMVHLWFPTNDSSSNKAEYFPEAQKIKGNYTQKQKKAVLSKKTSTIQDPKIAVEEKMYPVILFSPGADMPTYFYTSVLEELACNGYVVAAIDHTYEGVGQVFPDGTITGAEYEKLQPGGGKGRVTGGEVFEFYKKRVKIRYDDVLFVLDKIKQLNLESAQFRGKLNMDKLGIFGHSVGGVLAAQSLIKSQKFDAAINYDGLAFGFDGLPTPFFQDDVNNKVKGALLFIGKPLKPLSVKDLKLNNMTVDDDRERIAKQSRKIDSLISSIGIAAYRITLFTAVHESFSDSPFLNSDRDETQNTDMLQMIRRYTLEFFDQYLKPEKKNKLELTNNDVVVVQRLN